MVFSSSWWNTVRFGTAGGNRGASWGIAELPMAVTGGPLLRRYVLMTVLAARLLITNRLAEGNPTAGCVRRSLCVQNHVVFSTASPKAVRKTHR